MEQSMQAQQSYRTSMGAPAEEAASQADFVGNLMGFGDEGKSSTISINIVSVQTEPKLDVVKECAEIVSSIDVHSQKIVSSHHRHTSSHNNEQIQLVVDGLMSASENDQKSIQEEIVEQEAVRGDQVVSPPAEQV